MQLEPNPADDSWFVIIAGIGSVAVSVFTAVQVSGLVLHAAGDIAEKATGQRWIRPLAAAAVPVALDVCLKGIMKFRAS